MINDKFVPSSSNINTVVIIAVSPCTKDNFLLYGFFFLENVYNLTGVVEEFNHNQSFLENNTTDTN